VYALIRGVTATLRWRWTDRSGLSKGLGAPVIYCIWHNRLALCMHGYWTFAHPLSRTPGMAAMASASKDGGLLAGILDCFKVQPVRGSSSRRGAQALLELTTWAERGYDLALTPDGPRGPCYVVQEGAVALAQVTGLPILPATINVDWKIRVKSWDRFQIPLPFSRCEMITEKPVRVPREATDAEREECRRRLEETMRAITRD
jgi:lysophospholipid acyltransferase (LPLAT)-like uncharacterized protein